MIRIVRVHELDPGVPGARFLVDRLWPRGVARDALELDGWLRDAAPSDELRRWFGHDPARRAEFRPPVRRRARRLPETWAPLRAAAAEGDVVLLYAARDREHDNAVVLRDHLEQAIGAPGR